MAGLSCAIRLHEAGRRVTVVEAQPEPGGRIRTDTVDAFRLDRGFQVFLTAYPAASRILDMPSLRLGRFEPGAMVWTGRALTEVSDPLRRPQNALPTLFSPVGSLADKLRIAALKQSLAIRSTNRIFSEPERETRELWDSLRFSEDFQNRFLRPFFGGIFLEDRMLTSSRMFAYVFKMFSRGYAALPRGGMQAIPDQLAKRLPAERVMTGQRVLEALPDRVRLENGGVLKARAVVLAADMTAAGNLAQGIQRRPWTGTRCMYFSADRSPLAKPIIAFNGSGKGRVSNLSVPSDVASGYAPAGKSLICVSLRDCSTAAPADILDELRNWFRGSLSDWEFIRSYEIREALPRQFPGDNPYGSAPPILPSGLYIAGDYLFSGSIEGAVRSGLAAADAVIGYATGRDVSKAARVPLPEPVPHPRLVPRQVRDNTGPAQP